MNKELEHKLAQARKDREQMNVTFDAEINSLKAQIAEGEKPKLKLRGGDYGFFNKVRPRLFVKNEGKIRSVIDESDTPTGNPENFLDDYTILGNIFDDMQAMSEPLEEFEVQCNCGSRDILKATTNGCKSGCVYLKMNDNISVHFHGNSFHDFILNLRRMEVKLAKK